MTTSTYEYQPDYAVPPGWVLEEHLDVLGLSQSEFARRCGRSKKLISEIISGKAKIEPKTALQFERVLGLDAKIWIGIEADYRLHLQRQAEAQKASKSATWAKKFPIRELIKRKVLPEALSDSDTVSELLSFFGVASVEAWEQRMTGRQVPIATHQALVATALPLPPGCGSERFKPSRRSVRTTARRPSDRL